MPDLAEKVVVFDDPFTNQDRSRRTCTQQLLAEVADRAKQVFVFSHDPDFLKLIWNSSPNSETQTLQMTRLGAGTVIVEWDIEKEMTESYCRMRKEISTFCHNGSGDPRSVAQTLRPILEEHLRFRLVNQFTSGDSLGDMIARIRDAQHGTPLAQAQPLLQELIDINAYSISFHHGAMQPAEAEVIDQGEVEAFAK